MAHARLDKLVRRLRGDLGPVRWSQVDGAGRLLWLSVVAALGRWTADRVFGPSAAWYSWPVALRMREVADPIDPDALLGVLLAGGPAGPAAYADRCGIADMPRRRTRDRATAKPDRAAAEAEAIAAGSPSARSWPSTCAARAEISARMAIGRGKK